MLDTLGPGEVGDMNQTVDTFINTNEDAEIGDVLDLAFDDCADREFLANDFPWVRLDLLEPQGDAAIRDIESQHDGFNFVTDCQQFVGVLDALGPAHL